MKTRKQLDILDYFGESASEIKLDDRSTAHKKRRSDPPKSKSEPQSKNWRRKAGSAVVPTHESDDVAPIPIDPLFTALGLY